GIDLNRAGTPLIEIVSEPDMRTATEAVAYLKSIHSLVRYLDICDGNMQEGSFRCDANVSIRPKGQVEYGTRAELKNINSFRFVEKAIEFEVERQIDILESGGRVVQETRLYDSDKNETRSMRSKEEANDYRYFPDPDLPQMVLEDSFIDAIRAELPELPSARCERFISEYGLSDYDAETLTTSKPLADYYEQAVAVLPSQPKLIANWVNGELSAGLNRNAVSITESPVTAAMLGQLVARIDDNTISGKIAKGVFEAIWNGEGSADEIIEKRGLKQISDNSAIEPVIDEILANNPNQIEQYKAGNSKLLGFFVGQVMKATHGKANPKQVNDLLRKKLGS
ncbi:MAG TPA: Asp-tRNA(Asn)/Glu-tRNA(Gln) amidotransferase subunit GatB, partial [Gammaproteobacteria bacterium]|nr:Asp-tRNA(Asn)/Glu-tRNA(Gln) amidotransferase subunit GatB [Gammaproteobacteria bacterium]